MADDVFHLCAQGGVSNRLIVIQSGRLWQNDLAGGTWQDDWPTPAPERFVNVTVTPMNDGYTFVSTIADSGDLYAIGVPGGEWAKNWPVAPPTRLVTLAGQAGDLPNLYALDIHNDLYAISIPSGQWSKDALPQPPSKLVRLAAQGVGGQRLFGIGEDGNLYVIYTGGIFSPDNPGTWIQNWPAPPPVPLKSIAVQDGPQAHLFALDVNNEFWAIGLPEGQWTQNWPSQPPVPLVNITAEAQPFARVFGIDATGTLYAMGLSDGIWVKDWPQPLP